MAIHKPSRSVKVFDEAHGKSWSVYQTDCVSFAEQLPENCIDFTIYSPPFANLYVYSDRVEDMGNCKDDSEFMEGYAFLVRQLLRITKPGRLCAVHCCDLPSFKWRDGEIAFKDFSGALISCHVDEGWINHSPRITIWKDPVVEMQRTKALGLLHKQIKKDSTMCRVGNPDYILVFRKPGANAEPVMHPDDLPVETWQKWASCVWMDIDQPNTLNRDGARGLKDEKHIAPLQLDVIERCVRLWSNRGDIVFSPYMGIASEGFQAVNFKRKFLGTELKPEYFGIAKQYLAKAEAEAETLFDRGNGELIEV